MNPESNKFEHLVPVVDPTIEALRKKLAEMQSAATASGLVRPDGSPVPTTWTWSVFTEGEIVVINNYRFRIAHIGESYAVVEPVGPVVVGQP